MIDKSSISNNQGAISALKGYRVQFLYSLLRILTYNDIEAKFKPEGEFEDLDIYDINSKLIEIIQVKSFGKTLTLSDITTSKKDNTFLKRALKVLNNNKRPKIKLVSFGEVNDDIKSLSVGDYSEKFIKKLNKQGLNKNEIDRIQNNFTYEVVNEDDVIKSVILHIEKRNSFANINITLDLLIYWIYHSAEKQLSITPKNFKEQFDKICKFQSERISFNKTFNSLIVPLDNEIETEDILHLKSDFYKGISSSYNHILADVDVHRIDKIKLINRKFKDSDIVFIHGASGQGKSTLAYRYLYENCSQSTIFELKHLPEDINIIYDVINSLEGISKGIRFPITIYIDIEPGNKEWINIIRELASKKHFKFLVTIREEDWNSIELVDKFSFSEIELLLDYEEAELIYTSLNDYNQDFKFTDFEDAWADFGGNGPLLEFVYLITQNESLSSKLKSQINRIRSDSSNSGVEKIKLLRYIVIADCYGSKIKLKELNQTLHLNNDILLLIDLLQKEYLIKISGDKNYITGLHPIRSKIIKGFIFDNEINVEADYVLDAISFISDNTILNFIRNAFRYSNISVTKLLKKLEGYTPQKWQSYLSIFKSLLWKGIDDYIAENRTVLDEIYSEYNKGWIIVVDFDFTDIMHSGGMMVGSGIYTDEQKQYAIDINNKFTDKQKVFAYSLKWLNSITQINIIPDSKTEWNSFALFLFWLEQLSKTNIEIEFNKFKINKELNILPLNTLAQIIYALKKFNTKLLLYVAELEQVFLQKISEKFNVISIEQDGDSIIATYIFDIIDEQIDTDESDILNAKSVKIIELLRIAYPEKESYNTKGIGHKFAFLPDDYDSSIKEIPKQNLPLEPLVDINSSYLNLFNYTKRPKSWQDYVDSVIKRRLLLNEVLTKMVKAFSLSHKQNNLQPLMEYIQDYSDNYQDIIKSTYSPIMPQSIIDEWGEYGEGSAKVIKSNFDNSNLGVENKEKKQILGFEKYSKYSALYSNIDNSLENYLWQSAESIFRKIKISINEDVSHLSDNARISLVGNLFKVYELITEYQKSFKSHFKKFVDHSLLNKLERNEFENISTLCFLYRQFIYSDIFIKGNVSNTNLKSKDVIKVI